MSEWYECGRCGRTVTGREINTVRMTASGLRCLPCYERGKRSDGQTLPRHLRMANTGERWA